MDTDVLIIGGGLSGLAAACRLEKAGVDYQLVEASDRIGGRVKTDEVDGFLLDHGFQVLLDAYPCVDRVFEREQLALNAFTPGAQLWKGGRIQTMHDVFRAPEKLLATALTPVGTIKDKLLVGKLRMEAKRWDVADIWTRPNEATEKRLRDYGFSDGFIDLFFRGFYGGIFLEKKLETSRRFFDYTFKLFTEGYATLPTRGMGALPEQLAQRLNREKVHASTRITKLAEHEAETPDGKITFRKSILTSGFAQMTESSADEGEWNGTVCHYFAAAKSSALEEQGKLIRLSGDRTGGRIAHTCVPSQVAASYAPEGKELISVSEIGCRGEGGDAVEEIKAELTDWYGGEASQWQHIKSYRIPKALPRNKPDHQASDVAAGSTIHLHAGDWTTSPSIEGAILSGEYAAERCLSV